MALPTGKLGTSDSTLGAGFQLASAPTSGATTHNLSASDSIALSQTEDSRVPIDRVVTSTLIVTQVAVGDITDYGRLATDTLVLSDLAKSNIKTFSVLDTINLTESTRFADTFDLAASDTISVSDAIILHGDLSFSLSSSLSLTDIADTSDPARQITDTIVFVQSASVDLVKTTSDTITLTQSVTLGAIALDASDIISLTQKGRVSPFETFAPVDTLALTQEALSSIHSFSVTDTISLSQTITEARPFHLSASNALTEEVLEFNDGIGQPITVIHELSDLAEVQIDAGRNLLDQLSFSQLVIQAVTPVGGFALSASDTLLITDVSSIVEDEQLTDTLTITDVAIAFVANETANQLTLTDEAIVKIDTTLVINQSIALGQSVTLEVSNTDRECEFAPIKAATTRTDLPTPPRATFPPPLAGRTTDRFRLVYPDFSITDNFDYDIALRAPVLGNREGIQSLRINSESRGGTLHIFADPLWPQFYRLVMEMVGLTKLQAFDLINFLDNTLGLVIGIQDHEGRGWKGVVINPDDAVVEDHNNRYTVSLEIEADQLILPGLDAEDALNLTDTDSVDQNGFGRILADSLSLSDSALAEGVISVTAESTIDLSQDDSLHGDLGKVLSESLDLSDNIGLIKDVTKPVTNALTITDVASVERTVTTTASDTLTISDVGANTRDLSRVLASPLALTQVGAYDQTTNQSTKNTIFFDDRADSTRDWGRSLASALGLSDEACGTLGVPTLSGSLIHRWDATEITGLVDGNTISTVTDTGASGVDLQAWGGLTSHAPIYKTGILNGRPVMRFTQGIGGRSLESTGSVTLFPARRGTVFTVMIPREDLSTGTEDKIIFDNRTGINVEKFYLTQGDDPNRPVIWAQTPDGIAGMESNPPDYLPEDEPQILVTIRDTDTSMRFRRNHIEKSGRTLPSNPPQASGLFSLGGRGSSIEAMDQDIAVCLVYDKVLSDDEIDQVECYLKVTYGI